MPEPADPLAQNSLRLLFTRENSELRLVSSTPVSVATPALDTSMSPAPGHYLELRNSDNVSLGRTAVADPFAGAVEVVPAQPGDPITRIETEQPTAFSVLVPAPDDARNVALVRLAASTAPPTLPGTADGVAGLAPSLAAAEPEVTELATFPLDLS